MKRKPAFAGQFYPYNEKELRMAIAEYSPETEEKKEALGVLCPHAGYVFSGAVAGKVFAGINIPRVAVVLNPGHNYSEPPFALWADDAWETPLGEIPIHNELNSALADIPLVTTNNRVHVPEHSAEVVLPFLQYHRADISICVICVGSAGAPSRLTELGREIAAAIRNAGVDDALIVASSDMSHEQGPDALTTVNINDPLAVEKMERLDPEGLLRVCRENEITMCGVMPAAVMMESVRARGGSQGELLMRMTSADSPQGRGDYVVGYAGMIFS